MVEAITLFNAKLHSVKQTMLEPPRTTVSNIDSTSPEILDLVGPLNFGLIGLGLIEPGVVKSFGVGPECNQSGPFGTRVDGPLESPSQLTHKWKK